MILDEMRYSMIFRGNHEPAFLIFSLESFGSCTMITLKIVALKYIGLGMRFSCAYFVHTCAYFSCA